MSLTTYALTDFTTLLATQYTANAAIPANTDTGSTLGAIFNADALLALAIQSELVYVNGVTRLATSFGADCDTFGQPFNVIRIGDSLASGECTFTTPNPVTQTLVVPVGGVVATVGGLQFTVTADPTNPYYSALLGGFTISPGVNPSSVTALVTCNVAGIGGNVAANQITQIIGGVGLPITGIATVSNTVAFENGVNEETDAQYKARFQLQASTGTTGTSNAILAAIADIQVGLTYSFGDLIYPNGSSWPGGFTVVVNELGQSTGPSSALLSAANAAVLATKAAGASYQCIGPALITVSCTGTIVLMPGAASATVVAAANAAFTTFVNNIGLNINGGSTICALSQVYAAIQAVPGVLYVDGLMLNGATADISAPFASQLVAGTAGLT